MEMAFEVEDHLQVLYLVMVTELFVTLGYETGIHLEFSEVGNNYEGENILVKTGHELRVVGEMEVVHKENWTPGFG